MIIFVFPIHAQTVNTEIPMHTPGEIPGDSDVADQYAAWAMRAIDEGRWNDALSALERARDFSSVSSDVSYLLALARNHFGQPLGAVLQVLDEALGAARWHSCSPEDARYLKAELLLRLKRYAEALPLLDSLPETPKTANLKLKALRFFPAHDEFRRFTQRTFELYPRESEPVRIFLDFIKSEYDEGRLPQRIDIEFLETVFRRLPVLLQDDPELAWMAAPFMRDTEEARRLVSAYRAVNKPQPFSLPAALNLGVIDDETAVEEFFAASSDIRSGAGLDKRLLEELYRLMRDEPRREFFRGNLLRYSGVIKEDTNGDGFYEMTALYSQGMLVSCSFDLDQDGLPELEIGFEAGDPKTAAVPALPEASDLRSGSRSAFREADRQRVFVRWEQFPAVLEARLGNEFYLLRPLELMFAPVQFHPLAGTGLLFPEAVSGGFALGRRSLIVHSLRVERPSREFRGALEAVELNQGIPIRAREYLEGRLVSETDFLRGRPMAQRVDLDLDGRLETVRHFRRLSLGAGLAPLEDLLDYDYDFDYADSDWDGDGIYERRQYD